MPSPDPAKTIKTALQAHWATAHPGWGVTLHVDDNYRPTATTPLLLVADDGGPPVFSGAWMVRKTPRRPLLRFTAFALGRDQARAVVDDAADWVIANRPAGRIEDVSDPLVTRDRQTGAFLASITMPIIVKPITTP